VNKKTIFKSHFNPSRISNKYLQSNNHAGLCSLEFLQKRKNLPLNCSVEHRYIYTTSFQIVLSSRLCLGTYLPTYQRKKWNFVQCVRFTKECNLPSWLSLLKRKSSFYKNPIHLRTLSLRFCIFRAFNFMPVFKLLLTPKSWPILPIFVDPLEPLQNTMATKIILYQILLFVE
jgi:hypothetical protein